MQCFSSRRRVAAATLASLLLVAVVDAASAEGKGPPPKFQVVETTIPAIQAAILAHKLTATELVHLYLDRIKTYNGTCVNQPEGVLGPVTTIPNAGQVNALMTLNLRPASRVALGFDAHKARSMTDAIDDDPACPTRSKPRPPWMPRSRARGGSSGRCTAS